MELFPTRMVLEAGEGGGGGGREVRRNVEGEEGLCPEETLQAPVPRPFRFQSFRDLCQRSPVARKERDPDHDHGKRRSRLATCQSCHSSVWYSLSLLLCVDLVCVPQPRRITYKKKIPKCKNELLLRTPYLPHTSRRLRPAMLEVATDEEHGPAAMRVVGIRGTVWWLVMALRIGPW